MGTSASRLDSNEQPTPPASRAGHRHGAATHITSNTRPRPSNNPLVASGVRSDKVSNASRPRAEEEGGRATATPTTSAQPTSNLTRWSGRNGCSEAAHPTTTPRRARGAEHRHGSSRNRTPHDDVPVRAKLDKTAHGERGRGLRGTTRPTPPPPLRAKEDALVGAQPSTELSRTQHESSLSDITMSDTSHASLAACDAQNSTSSRASVLCTSSSSNMASFGDTAGPGPGRQTRHSSVTIGEDLEQQRQQAPLSIEEDLFIYDDIVISKNEARTKHWRLAGRKVPFGAGAEGHRDGVGRRSSTAAGVYAVKRPSDPPPPSRATFSFTDFDVCVDEMDITLDDDGGAAAAGSGGGFATTTVVRPSSESGAGMTTTRRTVTFAGRKATVTSVVVKSTESARRRTRRVTNPGGAPCLTALRTTVLTGHATRVKCIAVAPSEQDYASCSNEDASIALTNLRLRDEVGIFTGHQETIINATFSSDGKYLATTSKDKTMILWDVVTNKQLLTYEHAKVVICCAFSPDNKYLVSGCQDRICRLWDTRRGSEWLSYTHHDGIIISVAYSPDGGHICSASADKTLRVWSATTAKTRFTLTGHIGIILACNYTTDGRYIVSNDESQLRVWSTEDGTCTLSLAPGEVAGVTRPGSKGPKLGWTLSCNAPGAFTDYILVACNNRFVYVLDRATGKEVASAFCKAPVYCLTVGSKEVIGCGDSFGNVYIMRLL